ncbi:MAG: DNA polymerase III subunit gamma/tau [Gammaproteobacteria bacterium]|nr:DNA polymerase III subunit gamma/tau [Gammaproteobacteria bacterium]
MAHQVLARKWRPHNFETVVGQQHVVQALINSLNKQRLHHAYLFTGTRGVGKTTIARILAKCLNCETGVTAMPCDQCATCTECDEGRFVDLIEVDAASRTKVEDTRDLLNNVQYLPTRGRFKIYLIDEVHMLSTHSFNALLKTLEEPPKHVIFLLATTNPKKLPITILSRCLQFHLKNLTADQITTHLESVVTKENISFEAQALRHIAEAAKGSVRDALSLLDQTIAFGNGEITSKDTNILLGVIDQSHIDILLKALVNLNGKEMLDTVKKLNELGADFTHVLDVLMTRLHKIAIAQVVPENFRSDINEKNAFMLELSQQWDPETVQLYYQIALMGRRDMNFIEDKKLILEMTLLRMLAFTLQETEDRGCRSKHTASSPTGFEEQHPIAEKEQNIPPRINTESSTKTDEKLSLEKLSSDWNVILPKLDLKGVTFIFASHCVLANQENDKILLHTSPQYKPLFSKKTQQEINEALNIYFKRPISLKIDFVKPQVETPADKKEKEKTQNQLNAFENIEADPHVKTLVDQFKTDLQLNLVEPLKE